MSKAILTPAQSRLTLQILLFTISGVALASSIFRRGSGGTEMLSGIPGDIRGISSLLGGAGLVLACTARIALLCVPHSWRCHVDRLEFGLVSVLWIAWTSATMAFSAFTVNRGTCDRAAYQFPLPTCSILTFDLVLVHLASLTTLSLLLVILSAALQPASDEVDSKDDVWVMWDLVLHDHDDHDEQLAPIPQQASYGTRQPSISPPPKVDKFQKGRLWTYGCLSLCSFVSLLTAVAAAMTGGEQVPSVYFLEVVAGLSLVFGVYHLLPRSPESNTRQRRMLEVAVGSVMFLLWPIAAIAYTLFPAIANRPCAGNSNEGDLPTINDNLFATCMLSRVTMVASWLASWLLFARLLGLVFPMPSVLGVASGERAPLLLAGADFELGDEEDTEVRLMAL